MRRELGQLGILPLVLQRIQMPCREHGGILENHRSNTHKPICISILSRLTDIGYDLGILVIGIRSVGCKRCYFLEEFSWGRNGWWVFWESRGEKISKWVGGGGGKSEGFVETVFELEADAFIWGNEEVVGNRKENWVVDRKVRKLWDGWHKVRGQQIILWKGRGESEASAHRLRAPKASLRAEVWVVSRREREDRFVR